MSKKKPRSNRRPTGSRNFPRTARLNALLREIVAEYLERTDDERLPLVTVTGTEVDSDLNRCDVYVSTFEDPDPARDAEVLEVLNEHRVGLQRAIAQQAKLRKTPEVVVQFDPAVRTGARVESILASLGLDAEDENRVDDADADADDRSGTEWTESEAGE